MSGWRYDHVFSALSLQCSLCAKTERKISYGWSYLMAPATVAVLSPTSASSPDSVPTVSSISSTTCPMSEYTRV